VPGKNLYGIPLGATRAEAVSAATQRWPKAKRQRSEVHRDGTLEDWWIIPNGTFDIRFDVLSRKNKVVQLGVQSLQDGFVTRRTFAQLLHAYHLKKTVYDFRDPGGGGYVGFYYDDAKRGICFALGTQDIFLLTYRPDAIVVHAPNKPIIPFSNGATGKIATGERARAYRDLADFKRSLPQNGEPK
jgi:hypothetical protein